VNAFPDDPIVRACAVAFREAEDARDREERRQERLDLLKLMRRSHG
jgi:hypothetical protein